MAAIETLFRRLDGPIDAFDPSFLGDDFAAELQTVSRLWFACGYAPGVGAYLNFFLLRDFIELHDRVFPPRFATFRSMADSFYRTDLFVRDVTDSGREPTGGISSAAVRGVLSSIMARHEAVSIPGWMMTYFGFSLFENVERQCAPLDHDARRRHLSYMAKAYRLMGVRFSSRRDQLEEFARAVEREHAGPSPQLETHARNILVIGEMIGVSSSPGAIQRMLPDATRAVYAGIADRVRPGPVRRAIARVAGRVVLPRAVGAPRVAVPVAG